MVQSLTWTRPPVMPESCLFVSSKKYFGKIFSRRVHDIERLEIVDHLMVKIFNDRPQNLLEFLEVEQQAGGVEFPAPQGHTHLVVCDREDFAHLPR